jgi:hypothetical protein
MAATETPFMAFIKMIVLYIPKGEDYEAILSLLEGE